MGENDQKGPVSMNCPEVWKQQLLADYSHGVIHLAVLQHIEKPARYQLLFGFAELLPKEIPREEMPGPFDVELSDRSRRRVWVLRAVAGADAVLAWYISARRGLVALEPPGFKSANDAPGRSQPVEKVVFLEEPSFPGLVLHGGDGPVLPFLADWYQTPRVHHLIQASTSLLAALNSEDREKLRGVLADKLHLDVDYYPELVGSLHLVLPNPILRKVGIRLAVERNRRGGETVLVRVHPRAGQSLEGLKLGLFETRPTGVGHAGLVDLVAPLTRFELPAEVDHLAVGIVCPQRGLLYLSKPTPFLKQINIGMNLISGRRKVRLDNENGQAIDQYSVDVVGTVEAIQIGESFPQPALQLLREGSNRRETHQRANSLGQKWFSGNPQEAIRFIRSVVGRTSSRVLIVDPYFGHDALVKVAPAVSNSKARILILSSKKYLRDKLEATPEAEEAEDTTKGDVTATSHVRGRKGDNLKVALDTLRAQPMANTIEVRVMPSADKPIIHDRFLAVDEKIWVLGSSVNGFGGRGTIAVQLADPDPVLRELLEAWNQSEELDAWLKDLHHKQDAEGENG